MADDVTPVVGLSCYTPLGSDSDSYSLPRYYIEALWEAGAQAVLLPGGDAGRLLCNLDGVVLAGGGDIDSSSYGRDKGDLDYFVDPDRDRFELALLKEALALGMPVLAICRGMQILNVSLGGDLLPHLPDRFGSLVPHRLPPREPVAHDVVVDTGSSLYQIVRGESFEVMSWHHQAVDRLGNGLRAVAWAADGVVEALECTETEQSCDVADSATGARSVSATSWLVAVQWHPELNYRTVPAQRALFSAFVSQCVRRSRIDFNPNRHYS